MMVRIQVEDEEITEDSSFYDVTDDEDDDQGNDNKDINTMNWGQDSSCVGKKYLRNLYRTEDYKFTQKRWKALYNVGEAVRLQDAVKTHLFRTKFPDDDIFGVIDQIDNDFDPLEV
jgi:hypothetical protein